MRLITLLLMGLCFAIALPLSAESFYKWKDAAGVWHYDDKPPKDVPADQLKVHPGAGAEATTAATDQEKTPTESKNCLLARKNLEILNSHSIITKDLDGDGQPETLNLEQHKQEITEAEQQIAAFCKPAKTE